MEVLSENYKVLDIITLSCPTVPRAVLHSPSSEMALDYYKALLPLNKNENIQIKLYLEEPTVPSNIYLMRGVVYKLDNEGYECSFGGLLLFYKGEIHDNMKIDSEIFVSVAKI